MSEGSFALKSMTFSWSITSKATLASPAYNAEFSLITFFILQDAL